MEAEIPPGLLLFVLYTHYFIDFFFNEISVYLCKRGSLEQEQANCRSPSFLNVEVKVVQ